MEMRLDKEKWDFWVESCPVSTMSNINRPRITWAVFDDAISFKKWLKAIPLFEGEKDTQCLAPDQKTI